MSIEPNGERSAGREKAASTGTLRLDCYNGLHTRRSYGRHADRAFNHAGAFPDSTERLDAFSSGMWRLVREDFQRLVSEGVSTVGPETMQEIKIGFEKAMSHKSSKTLAEGELQVFEQPQLQRPLVLSR